MTLNHDEDRTSPSPAPDSSAIDNTAIVEQILSGARWASALRLIAQSISWVCTIIVVRFISTGDYGLNAMLETPLEFLFLLSTFGLDNALVRVKTLERNELRSAFGWLLLVNALLFLAYFFGSSLIAAYFNEPRLAPLAQVLAFVFLLIPFRVIPDAMLDRELKFRLKAFAELAASIVAALTALILAIMGAGIWALIAGVLTNRVLLAIILMALQPWFLMPSLDFGKVRGMIAFGGTMALASAIAITGNMLPVIVAGPSLGPATLGVFVVALQFALLPLAKIMPVINPIIFPAFSKFAGQRTTIANYMEKSIGVAALVLLPPMIGLSCVAEAFVAVVLGDKWLMATLPLTLLSLSVPFRGLTSFVRQVMGGIGHAGLTLKSTVFTWVLFFLLIMAGISHGLMGMVLAVVITEPLATIFTVRLSTQVMDTSFKGIVRCLRPALLSTAGMAMTVILSKWLLSDASELLQLGVGTGVGIVSYLVILKVWFADQLKSTLELLRR